MLDSNNTTHKHTTYMYVDKVLVLVLINILFAMAVSDICLAMMTTGSSPLSRPRPPRRCSSPEATSVGRSADISRDWREREREAIVQTSTACCFKMAPISTSHIQQNVFSIHYTLCKYSTSQPACMTTFTTPCMWTKSNITTPKLKELQRFKSRCKQLLLAATTTPNFVVFCC